MTIYREFCAVEFGAVARIVNDSTYLTTFGWSSCRSSSTWSARGAGREATARVAACLPRKWPIFGHFRLTPRGVSSLSEEDRWVSSTDS